jgi:hypothetical protein
VVRNSRVLLMYTDMVKELPGYSCTELSLWEFPFFKGACRQGGNSMWYCLNGMLQKETLENVHKPVCFRILSSSLTSVSIFSVCCYSSVSISGIPPNIMVDRRVVRGNTYSPFRSNVFNFNIPSKQVNNSSLFLSFSGIIYKKLLLQNLPLDSCFIFRH